jgi:hypothetical protein
MMKISSIRIGQSPNDAIGESKKRRRNSTTVIFLRILCLGSLFPSHNDRVQAFQLPQKYRCKRIFTTTTTTTTKIFAMLHEFHLNRNSLRKPHVDKCTKPQTLSITRKVGGIEILNFNERPKLLSTESSTQLPSDFNATTSNANNPMHSSAGFFFALAVILALGLTTSTTSDTPSLFGFSISTDNELNEVALATATRVIDASVPTSSSAYFAAALGESIGGVIGASLSVVINVLLRRGMTPWSIKNNQEQETNGNNYNNNFSMRKQPIMSQALADGDYFIANSATVSLLVALGVAPEVAKLSSVFIAVIPSELVKLAPKLREQRTQEDQILQQLLQEQQEQQRLEKLSRRSTNNLLAMLPKFGSTTSSLQVQEDGHTVDPSLLIPVTGRFEIDFVEIFADVTRWLEYE